MEARRVGIAIDVLLGFVLSLLTMLAIGADQEATDCRFATGDCRSSCANLAGGTPCGLCLSPKACRHRSR